MAGSLKWFLYTTDAGAQFAIFRDESNLEAVNAAAGDYTATDTVVNAVPRNIRLRYLTFENTDGTIRRNIPALTLAIYNAATPATTITDQVSGDTLNLVRKVGEVIRLPKAADTGITDGDAT